ncbi:MAG: hypothetical protein M9928_15525 [Anaerolineae bacterium]|nr:hypothetical protein [Anaerolineae bacterium]MCO5194577.1 hypothetical protein [Anaerolineae bacterium]MCO5199202.1 hypothetical protein [Anaerolineae bacterium]MCO5206446.1 hypothetical protein [Anaerolineae bacterium]
MKRFNWWLIMMLFGAFALGGLFGLPSIAYQALAFMSFGFPVWMVAAALIVAPVLLGRVRL